MSAWVIAGKPATERVPPGVAAPGATTARMVGSVVSFPCVGGGLGYSGLDLVPWGLRTIVDSSGALGSANSGCRSSDELSGDGAVGSGDDNGSAGSDGEVGGVGN
ncbi:hypothetical protein BDV93DRAFT_549702 [Ceratobasidium sp. AG-I]|nr:hypothetical protein BDV93DRAFT_549702 [Ceratobasidium sp. AG-I]